MSLIRKIKKIDKNERLIVMKLIKQDYTVTHNDLIEKYSLDQLTEREQNILMVLLSQIQKSDSFEKISLKRVKNLIDKKMTYAKLVDEIRELGNKRLTLISMKEIHDKKGNLISKKNDIWLPVLFSTIIIHEDEKSVSVKFNSDFEYIFYQIKGDFSKLNIKSFLGLKSLKWKTLYRFCKRWVNYDSGVDITLSNFKKIIGYEEEDEYKNIKRRVASAVKKINEISDITVDIFEKKQGRKVTSLVFKVTEKKYSDIQLKMLEMSQKFSEE